MYLLQHRIDSKGNSCYLNGIPTHPTPQNAGQYFELPGSGQGLSSQPEAYEHDGGIQILQCSS
ncbi:hypothetical protein EJ879_25805 [Shigella sonnei]|nr:hypothetical protein [Escherichia coli]RTD41989.1 hypothetical protein EJ879_25805 [Shigella sonnei]KAA1330489.1 hypothetical protein F1E03_15670 [Escherichia coli]MBW1544063.1 hypothetical protein [Escherichia coli]MBX0024177.1 hypothetical protein [Escherichia coli]